MGSDGKLMVSIKTAAEMLSVGRNTIYNLINKGQLKIVRLGDRALIPVSELERLVREGAK
jgi:excisionase family DNA binding protein